MVASTRLAYVVHFIFLGLACVKIEVPIISHNVWLDWICGWKLLTTILTTITITDKPHFVVLQRLQQRCVTKDKLDLNHFVVLQAFASYCSSSDCHIFYLDLDVVLPAVTFTATPINSIPIVPTALSKNLSGPLSMSDVQGEPKSGYLTMDHTRKLLLILESDPKIATLPLIGM